MRTRAFAERLKAQGWKFAEFTRCYEGHREEVFTNPDFPGLVWHRNCCGGWTLIRGILVETVEYALRDWD